MEAKRRNPQSKGSFPIPGDRPANEEYRPPRIRETYQREYELYNQDPTPNSYGPSHSNYHHPESMQNYMTFDRPYWNDPYHPPYDRQPRFMWSDYNAHPYSEPLPACQGQRELSKKVFVATTNNSLPILSQKAGRRGYRNKRKNISKDQSQPAKATKSTTQDPKPAVDSPCNVTFNENSGTQGRSTSCFFIDPEPSPVAIDGQRSERKELPRKGKKKSKVMPKKLDPSTPNRLDEDERNRAEKMQKLKKLARKRFESNSCSTLKNIPTEQLELLEVIASVPITESMSNELSERDPENDPGEDGEEVLGILGSAEPETVPKDDDDDEIEIVIPSPKPPPPLIDLDDPMEGQEKEEFPQQPDETSETSASDPICQNVSGIIPSVEPLDTSTSTSAVQHCRVGETSISEDRNIELVPYQCGQDSDGCTNAAQNSTQPGEESQRVEEGHNSERRQIHPTNPFLLANSIYSGDNGSFDTNRRLLNTSEQLYASLDRVETLQEEEKAIDLEIRALQRRKEQVHRQLMGYVKRIVNIGVMLPEEVAKCIKTTGIVNAQTDLEQS